MKISQKAKTAIYLGILCSVSYFAVYIARNALSAATPQMLAAGYTEAYIGSVSSLFFVFYAVGQLINGWIGDHIQAKWMISGGLLFALPAREAEACLAQLKQVIPAAAIIGHVTEKEDSYIILE